MTDSIAIGTSEGRALEGLQEQFRKWCREHQCEVGVGEMILGAGILCYGVKTGMIEVGREVLGLRSTPFDHAAEIGASIGGGALGVAGAMVGSIGVATSGGAIAVPGTILTLGGIAVGAALGYSVGDLVEKFFGPQIATKEILTQASLLVLGVALLVRGARRILNDRRVKAAGARIHDRAIRLGKAAGEVVMARLEDVNTRNVLTGAGIVTGTAASGFLGGAVMQGMAASTITVAGSKTLGAIGLSLGVLSVPAWPIVLGVSTGVGVFAIATMAACAALSTR